MPWLKRSRLNIPKCNCVLPCYLCNNSEKFISIDKFKYACNKFIFYISFMINIINRYVFKKILELATSLGIYCLTELRFALFR